MTEQVNDDLPSNQQITEELVASAKDMMTVEEAREVLSWPLDGTSNALGKHLIAKLVLRAEE